MAPLSPHSGDPTNHTSRLMSVPPGNPIIESREDIVSEGNETEIICTAMGSKPASTIRWMKGDKELQGSFANGRSS